MNTHRLYPRLQERPMKLIDYSQEHSIEHAYTQGIGWGVFHATDRIEIERIDENFPDAFDDEHAEWLVHLMAAAGDQAARQALRTINFSNIDDSRQTETSLPFSSLSGACTHDAL